mgnify:CR=1 FL=1
MSKIIETDIVIIGAGPVGLFTVFEAGLLGLDCHLIDNLDKVGGQCIELYPEKPIYDIPGVANQTGKEHIDALLEQIKPFSYETHLNQRVDVLEELPDNFWRVVTNENTEFKTKNVFIAAGAGAFEPRKPPVEDPDKFLSKGVDYAIPFVIKSIKGDSSFEGVELMHFETKEDEILECDEALFFFGLNKQLGPILDWEIDLDGKKIAVDTENYQTNKEGIFAVGDINTYPGKLDLILCGFHETTIAVQEAYKRINPGKRVPFGYTTSNKGLQEKLGVK